MLLLLMYVAFITTLQQYGEACFPVRLPKMTIDSETCGSLSPAAFTTKSLANDLDAVIDQNGLFLPLGTCECNRDDSWTRVAYLNMRDTSTICPSAWSTVNQTVRGCGRQPSSGASCDSVFYSTSGRSYTQVCGRIQGYQYGNPNAFNSSINGCVGLDGWYVDGISLTHGLPGSRRHLWTFANAWYEQIISNKKHFQYACPCLFSNHSEWPYMVPQFIGNNYFCATGYSFSTYRQLLPSKLLWDGADCTGNNTCCQFNQPPWFSRSLPRATSDDLEVRICADQETMNEDVYVSIIELYVR